MIETSAFLPNIHNIDNRFTIIFREKRPNITYFNSYLIILTFSDDLKRKGYSTLQWKLLRQNNNVAWNDKIL